MKRLSFIFFAVALASSAVAENKQTVWIDGQSVGKTVRQITFDGDNVLLTYTDESTQKEDMSLVRLSFSYGNASGISQAKVVRPAILQGKVFNLYGQFVGTSTEGLGKGVYIVNGKKVIIK